MVVLPKAHRSLQDQQKFTKRHGKIIVSGQLHLSSHSMSGPDVTAEESKPILLITTHLPGILHFVEKRLGKGDSKENQVNGA